MILLGPNFATNAITADRVLYARWQIITYAVSYGVGFATNGSLPSTQTKLHGITLTLATNTGSLARTDYSFGGWNTAANGSGTDYASGGSYTENAPLTLYPRWIPNTYTVTYNSNANTGGTPPANQIKTADVPLTIASNSGPNALTRTYYVFEGWRTVTYPGGTFYLEGASYTANAPLTLYASWLSRSPRTLSFVIESSIATLSWSAPEAPGTYEYQVERAPNGGTAWVVHRAWNSTLSASLTTYLYSGQSPMRWRVQARLIDTPTTESEYAVGSPIYY